MADASNMSISPLQVKASTAGQLEQSPHSFRGKPQFSPEVIMLLLAFFWPIET